LRDFKEYLEQKGITEGKINTYMTEQTIRDFLEQRVEHLSPISALDYTTGFNSLLKGLEQANITIPANPSRNDFLKDFRETFRSELKELEIERVTPATMKQMYRDMAAGKEEEPKKEKSEK
jgi:hypothetical protein